MQCIEQYSYFAISFTDGVGRIYFDGNFTKYIDGVLMTNWFMRKPRDLVVPKKIKQIHIDPRHVTGNPRRKSSCIYSYQGV